MEPLLGNTSNAWKFEQHIYETAADSDLDHAHLREFLQRRVRDGVLKRLIGKWLKAGVMEDGSISYPDAGSPQGGVVSPILANVFLHYVLDTWFEEEVKPRLRGRAYLIRYAFTLLGFTHYWGRSRNGRALAGFLDAVQRCWRKWLDRRNRQREMDWDKFNRLLKRYPLPPPKIVHSVYRHAANP